MTKSTERELVAKLRKSYKRLASRSEKTNLIDHMCHDYGFERKYAIKLLSGNRKYKDAKGRGMFYSESAKQLLIRVWRAAGCMCTKYLRASITQLLKNLSELEHVNEYDAQFVAKMSASTMDRMLKKIPRTGPGLIRKNRRSGVNSAQSYFECCSGEKVLAAETTPGHIQVDTVALCGGDLSGDFFWILTLTDRKTQWTEIFPVWNRSAYEVLNAMDILTQRFPFKILSLHYDNGAEFMNAHLVRFVKRHPEIQFQRSRVYHKNDNAHVEQKNGSVVRGLFGEVRIDDISQRKQLEKLCTEWSAYFNYCRPCIMLIGRTKKEGAKGYSKKYDAPKRPAERILTECPLSETKIALIRKRVSKTNIIEFYRFILRRWSRILRKQNENKKAKKNVLAESTPEETVRIPICK